LLAGQAWVDWLFMLGLLLIGAALILGIGVKIAGWTGAIMMALMFLAVLPPEHNPIIDEHVVYLFLLVGFTVSDAGNYLGFGKWWGSVRLVKKYAWLR
jgi:thiosulfate dehydrogenase [quinone] large subunit